MFAIATSPHATLPPMVSPSSSPAPPPPPPTPEPEPWAFIFLVPYDNNLSPFAAPVREAIRADT